MQIQQDPLLTKSCTDVSASRIVMLTTAAAVCMGREGFPDISSLRRLGLCIILAIWT